MAAEGYQGISGTGEGGSSVTSPTMIEVIDGGFTTTASTNRSAGRYPDGNDNDK